MFFGPYLLHYKRNGCDIAIKLANMYVNSIFRWIDAAHQSEQ